MRMVTKDIRFKVHLFYWFGFFLTIVLVSIIFFYSKNTIYMYFILPLMTYMFLSIMESFEYVK